jgi:hypothetical protein
MEMAEGNVPRAASATKTHQKTLLLTSFDGKLSLPVESTAVMRK